MKNNRFKKILTKMFDDAVSISHPANIMAKYIPDRQPSGKTVVIGAGKASAEMARAFEIAWKKKYQLLSNSKGQIDLKYVLNDDKLLSYVDGAHYSPVSNKKIALELYKFIE